MNIDLIKVNPDFDKRLLKEQVKELTNNEYYLDKENYFEKIRQEGYHLYKIGIIGIKTYNIIMNNLLKRMESFIIKNEILTEEDELPF